MAFPFPSFREILPSSPSSSASDLLLRALTSFNLRTLLLIPVHECSAFSTPSFFILIALSENLVNVSLTFLPFFSDFSSFVSLPSLISLLFPSFSGWRSRLFPLQWFLFPPKLLTSAPPVGPPPPPA